MSRLKHGFRVYTSRKALFEDKSDKGRITITKIYIYKLKTREIC